MSEPPNLVQQGLTALRNGQAAQAVALFGQAAQANAQDYDAAYGLGVALAQNQQLPEAVQWLNYAVSLRPDSVAALFNLGQAQFAVGDFEGAKVALQKVFTLNPKDPRPRELLVKIQQAEQQKLQVGQAVLTAENLAKQGSGVGVQGSETAATETCPQCKEVNPAGYRVCRLCGLPSPKLKEHKEVASARKEMSDRERQEWASELQGKKILSIMLTVAACLMMAQGARIAFAAKENSMVGQMILYSLVAEAAVPFFVALVVLTLNGAVNEGRSVVKAAGAVALAVVIALKVDELLIEPLFGMIISIIPFGGLILFACCIFIPTMIALEKVAGTRLDLSHSLAAQITIPTMILLFISSIVIGVAVVVGNLKDDPSRISTGKSAQEKKAEESIEKLMREIEAKAKSKPGPGR